MDDRFKNLKPHPLAARFPKRTGADREKLKLAIIASNGLIDPIVLKDGKIFDGNTRYGICLETGIEPIFVDYKSAWGDPIEWLIGKHSHRSMSVTQRAVLAEKFMDDLTKQDGRKTAPEKRKSSELAGMRFDVSSRSVEYTRAIRKASPEIYAELSADRVNVNQAMNRLKKKQREDAVRKLHRAAVKTPSKADYEIRRGDCLKLMEVMPAASFRVIFSDFPYNIGWQYHNDRTSDQLPDEQYVAWCASVIAECRRLLTDDGSIFIMVDDRYSDFVGVEMRRAGLHRQSTIVWWETFGTHNSAENGLTCRTRHLHYYTKLDSGFVFNTDVREPSARQLKYKDDRANPDGMIPANVWKVSRKQGTANDRVPFKDAPPQLPVEIPERCILLASMPGDMIFDPCTGNGTTAIGACCNGRRFIGCEQSQKYAKQAEQWIASELLSAQSRREPD